MNHDPKTTTDGEIGLNRISYLVTNEGTQGKLNTYSEVVFSNEYLEKTAADHVEVWLGDIRLIYSNDINVGISQQKIGWAFKMRK